MPDRSRDWLAQAERDLEHARSSADDGHHEWACFAAQQAAEKAVKAVHLSHLQEMRKHVIRELLEQLPMAVPPRLLDSARVLDGYYVATR